MHFNQIIIHIILWLLNCSNCWCALFYPTNSAYGIFAAIAVPLDLPHRSVFVSYNFEANYNLPATWGIPPIATGIEDEDWYGEGQGRATACANCTVTNESADDDSDEYNNSTQPTNSSENKSKANIKNSENTENRERRSLLTRTHFYHIIKDKLERSGYNGEPCLLRLICEINASELGEVNGVLGTLIHILFSPSTSKYEYLSLSYYQAEEDGANDQCHYYEEECKENILDLISAPLDEIMNDLMEGK